VLFELSNKLCSIVLLNHFKIKPILKAMRWPLR
jgi:hypothetical protein